MLRGELVDQACVEAVISKSPNAISSHL